MNSTDRNIRHSGCDPDSGSTRTRAVALLLAIALHALLLLILWYSYLSYPRPGMAEPQPMQPEPLTFVAPEEIDYEFDPAVIDHIMAGEVTPEPAQEQYGGDIPDAVDAGEVNETAAPVATPEPSPVQTTEKPKADQSVSEDISKRTGNAFGKKAQGDPKQVKDNSTKLTMTIANSPGARSDKEGKIVFQVNVNGQGKVQGKPTLLRSLCEGNAVTDDAIIARCRTIAAQQTFAVIAGSPTQLGTVTFTFTDKK